MSFSGAACCGPLPLRKARGSLLHVASGLFKATDSSRCSAAFMRAWTCPLKL